MSSLTATPTIALLGNPNTGKSTLFNALAGARQRVGNFPGCTVEKKTGSMHHNGQRFELVDLPGTYSLSPRSPDEMVAVDVLLGRRKEVKRPDAVVCIVDASNLERNLYLVSQVLELGLPTVVALNMTDVAEQRGLTIDIERLASQLGVPVIPLQANRGRGVPELKTALNEALARTAQPPETAFPEPFSAEVRSLEADMRGNGSGPMPRYLVERLLLDTSGYLEEELAGDAGLPEKLHAARDRLAAAGVPIPGVEAIARYGWVGKVLEGVVERPAAPPATLSDRIDRILTHKFLGTLCFALIMLVVFQSVFSWADSEYLPLMTWIENGVSWLAALVGGLLPEGALQSLVVDGIIGGVGNVLVFLPQILILFFFIAVLEDCGYMARAAYLMDKLMAGVGLSGKSFIPLLSSFACAIPGVMATRVIENRRDRLATIMVAPLMSCSARIPVYTLFVAAFIKGRSQTETHVLQTLVMAGMYLVGVVAAVIVAFALKKTLLKGETPPFVMELPSYKWPSARTVAFRMFDRGWAFVRRAGTLILAVTIVVWALLYFPHNEADVDQASLARLPQLQSQLDALGTELTPERQALEAELTHIENEIQGDYIRHSLLGQFGHFIEPAVRPLGWDWRIGSAALASFPAREVVVSTLGVIYNLGSEQDEGSSDLRDAIKQARWDSGPQAGQPVYNVPVALSIMVFFALCAQCGATLVAIKRETNSWGWPAFTFAYMTSLAYVVALVVYQVGRQFL